MGGGRTLVRMIAAALLAAAAGLATAAPRHVPVYRSDFADPFILPHQGEYLAYSTNTGGINLPMLASRDLVSWRELRDPAAPAKRHDAMPVLAPWVEAGRTWAPEVIEHGGRWLLYYTARHKRYKTQCIGVAVASDPRGPFRDGSIAPIVCQYAIGGTIDANPFRDGDGNLYLYYKADSNSIGQWRTDIFGQRLSPDGLRVVGPAVSMLTNDLTWERHVIEAPTMVRTGRGYGMFYSGNHFGWESHQRLSRYATGYATCRTPLGPCTDTAGPPLLASYNRRDRGCLSGPGHQVVFEANGRSYLGFHAWAFRADCRPDTEKGRYLYIAPLTWRDGKPQVGPSLRP